MSLVPPSRIRALRGRYTLRGARAVVAGVACAALEAVPVATPVAAQPPAPAPAWPFGIGEALRYEVRVAPFGSVGRARLWIEGPVDEQGVATWRLRSEIEAGVGPVHGVDRTSSWFDPATAGILRFEKSEDHPLSRSEARVTVDRAARHWRDGVDGHEGPVSADAPLDELAFLYVLRALPLAHDTTFLLSRHYDEARNPTRITVRGTELVSTPAGIFRTRVVEMEVKDPKRYHGVGRIRINVDDDVCRLPVRIESRMPRLGVTTLVLTGWAHPPRYPSAVAC